MADEIQYEAGEEVIFDYTDDRDRIIWGKHFEFGDAILVRLKHDLTSGDFHHNMGKKGPWGWGAFSTKWIESIAERIEWLYDDSVLYRIPKRPRPHSRHESDTVAGSSRERSVLDVPENENRIYSNMSHSAPNQGRSISE